MSDKLYEKDLYINPNIPFIFNTHIYEYDMKEAGFSLIKQFKLLDKDNIVKLEAIGKKERTIKIGVLQNKIPGLKENLKACFALARQKFFELNELTNNDIISIKKDAIFVTKECKYQKITELINFRPKNEYTSYIQLNKHLEFYYNFDKLDVKGLSDENYELHKDYMIKFIKTFFLKMETSNESDILRFYRTFIDKYKERGLEVGYYRTFDNKSKFELLDNDDNVEYNDFWEDEKDRLDISYNYTNVILKLVKILL
jgi:hypothetical protein